MLSPQVDDHRTLGMMPYPAIEEAEEDGRVDVEEAAGFPGV